MSTTDIQSHIYNSLLTGQTSDVCIRISGSFNATYKLHRVVLIQAGFFKDLFTGEFAESSKKRQAKKGVFEIVLNDRNIGRAAFEFSISRLYGGGPQLYTHPSLVPTFSRPLTSGFPHPPAGSLASSRMSPPGHQPATPEFLVSLLATSIYLSIPSLASEALTGILRTIGPRTVSYYLDFALGKTKLTDVDRPAVGLDGLAKDLDEQDITSQSSLSASLKCASDESLLSSSSTISNQSARSNLESPPFQFYYGPVSDKIGEACACWLARWGADMFEEEEKTVLDWLNDNNASLDFFEGNLVEERPLDELPFSADTNENRSRSNPSPSVPPMASDSSWSPKWSPSKTKLIPRLFTGSAAGAHEALSLDWIHALLSSNELFVSSPLLYSSFPLVSMHLPIPTTLPPTAVPAGMLIGAEEERYAFAKRVVELRRAVRVKVKRLQRKVMEKENERDSEGWDTVRIDKGKGKERAPSLKTSSSREWEQRSKVWEDKYKREEEQWDTFFRTSVYYANMTAESVITISKDISPSTGRPYVDLQTLQEAAWDAGIMKFTITGGNSTSALPSSPPSGEKLGLLKPASDILSAFASNPLIDVKPYFVVPSNVSLRVGDTITTSSGSNVEGNIHNNITMDELFANSFDKSYLYRGEDREEILRPSGRAGKRLGPGKHTKTSNESTFFGLLSDIYYPAQINDGPTLVPSLFSPSANPLPALSSFHPRLTPSQHLSSHPPLRFSVEFFNLELLKERDRLHSRTVWYAGSLWNVYAQIVKKKSTRNSLGISSSEEGEERNDARTGAPGSGILPNYQLGVYLHRHSPTDSLPPLSAPDPFADTRWLSKPGIPPAATSSTDAESHTPSAQTSQSSVSANRVSRGPEFSPLMPYASAPQVASSSTTALGSASSRSRLRGNSTSMSAPSSSHSSAPAARPRTPGGSGGWRNLASSNSNSPVASASSGSGFLSSSLPAVFPTFGRSRNQSSGSRDGYRRNITYGLPSASASTPFVGASPSSPSSPSPTPTPSSPPAEPPSSPSSSPTIPNPPFHAVISNHKQTYPYLDPRPVVSVYFSVNCASPTGTAQTRFQSAPDVFKLGQSWGWKSSGLIGGSKAGTSDADGDVEAALLEMNGELPSVGDKVSLRATVVLGMV